MIASSTDPKAVLRKEMVVEIMKNTFLIRVALRSREPVEAAAIVNAVVYSYLEQHGDYHRTANRALKKSLEEELQMLEVKISEKKKELRELLERGHIIRLNRPLVKSNTVKQDDEEIQPSLAAVTEEQLTKVTDRLLQADLDLIDARARLEMELAKQPNLMDRLPERQAAVEDAKRRRIGYAQYIARLEVQSKPQDLDTFDATLATQELEFLLKKEDIISQKLEELRFQSKQSVYRVTQHDQAQVPKVAATNPRTIGLPAASVGILFLVLGLFLTREIRATRAGDTDEAETSTGPSA